MLKQNRYMASIEKQLLHVQAYTTMIPKLFNAANCHYCIISIVLFLLLMASRL
jgi:hypothetical protein